MPHDAGCMGDGTTKLVMETEIIIMLKTQKIDQHCESSTLKEEWRCRKAFENKYISELLPFSVYDKGHKHAIEVDQWQLLIILPKHGNVIPFNKNVSHFFVLVRDDVQIIVINSILVDR